MSEFKIRVLECFYRETKKAIQKNQYDSDPDFLWKSAGFFFSVLSTVCDKEDIKRNTSTFFEIVEQVSNEHRKELNERT